MGNKMDARKRSFKGNKHTNSLLNTLSVTGTENDGFTTASIDTEITDVVTSVETASTKKPSKVLLLASLILLLKIIHSITKL